MKDAEKIEMLRDALASMVEMAETNPPLATLSGEPYSGNMIKSREALTATKPARAARD